jgi:pilus assembly protein CpaB
MNRSIRQGLTAFRHRLPLWRRAALVAGALGFGLLAVLGANAYIQERVDLERARLAGEHERVEVLVARRALQKGEILGPDTLAVRALPRHLLPGGALSPARIDAVQGLKLQWPLQAGEPVLASAVFAAESQGLSSRLRTGGRAMTIAVDETNAISGLLQPGDRIDLLLSWRPAPVGGTTQPEITRSVMQDVVVIATGRHARATPQEEGAGRSFSAITVEVDPDQAQRLVVAQRSGRLTAVLRNPLDRESVDERPLDVHELMGVSRPGGNGVSALINALPWSASARQAVEPKSHRPGLSALTTSRAPTGSERVAAPSTDPSVARSVPSELKVELIIGGRGPVAGPGDGSWSAAERGAASGGVSGPKPMPGPSAEVAISAAPPASLLPIPNAAPGAALAAPAVPLLR